ncbi:fungal-specific transcription factor domain-containing protein [Nemania sp. NC0429]|nr:fungal-specific transcription factor domain-containing protein [Nemania sp. NC0429]
MPDEDVHASTYTGPGNTPRGRARLPSSRRRDKPQLSCNLCRRRKLRCNREQPCSSCAHRGLDASCSYSATMDLSPGVENGQAHKRPGRLQDRIQHLEDLVVELMHKSSASIPVSESQASAVNALPQSVVPKDLPSSCSGDEAVLNDNLVASDIYSIEPSETGAGYVNGEHWAAILDSISELKEHFDKEKSVQHVKLISDSHLSCFPGPQLLLGCSRPPQIGDILASIPSRPMVDRLVFQYFNSFEMSPAILHTIQFSEEYKRFWEEPSATSCIWLGLLFAIMCLAAQFQKFSSDPSSGARESTGIDLEALIATFRQRCVQCLVLGRYTKGGPNVLEALLLYFANEHFLCKDAEIDVWIILSIIVQIAIHTGYHRDPKHFKSMSPYTGEMRRRVWATISELDIGISAQMGVPRLIKRSQVDTEEPRNLKDSDFNESTQSLPPRRPDSELTPMLYRIAKGRLIFAFGLIWDAAADMKLHSYAEITEADGKLENAHRSIPICLEWQSMEHCITDAPQVIMQKLSLKSIYWRAKIVLHRKFLDAQYAYSREACLNAAFHLLDYQHMLDEETQPFGRLYQDRWRVSSIVNHDFLLAASLLCSYLQVYHPAHQLENGPEVENIITYLARSREIWVRTTSVSKEARKAVQALDIILRDRTTATSTPLDQDTVLYELQSLAGYTDPTDSYGYESLYDYMAVTSQSPPLTDLSTIDNMY